MALSAWDVYLYVIYNSEYETELVSCLKFGFTILIYHYHWISRRYICSLSPLTPSLVTVYTFRLEHKMGKLTFILKFAILLALGI